GPAMSLPTAPVSTHEHGLHGDEAERCTRLGYIAFGEMLAEGTADELRARFGVERLEDVFIRVMQHKADPR
ncbi:MAG: hypothetical protein ACT4QA_10805, partial [Panacagrimonas sp.]